MRQQLQYMRPHKVLLKPDVTFYVFTHILLHENDYEEASNFTISLSLSLSLSLLILITRKLLNPLGKCVNLV